MVFLGQILQRVAHVAEHRRLEKQRCVPLKLSVIIATVCLAINFGCSHTDSQLIKRLIYSDERTRQLALRELEVLDADSKTKLVPALVKALKYKSIFDKRGNDVVYRYRAADTLGMIGPLAKEAAPVLIHALRNDESDLVRTRAASALAKLGLEAEKAVPVFMEALKDKDSDVWKSAYEALGDIGKPAIPVLIEALNDKDITVRHGAVNALGLMGPQGKEAASSLLQALKDKNTEEALRSGILAALAKIGPADTASGPTLIHDLSHEDERVRLVAVNAIVEKGGEAIPALTQLLADKLSDTRFWASYALGMIGIEAKEAVPALIKALEDEDKSVRGNVLWALKRIDPAAAGKSPLFSREIGVITDDELASIEKMVEGIKTRMEKQQNHPDKQQSYPQDVAIVLQAIDRLRELLEGYPTSAKIDQVLFMSGQTKVLMGSLLLDFMEKNPLAKNYYEKHQEDYFIAQGIMYKGGDFQKLLDDYPGSPLADDASFAIVSEKGNIGECEFDMDCHIGGTIKIVLPFMKGYPASPMIQKVVGWVNYHIKVLDWDTQERAPIDLGDIEATAPLLDSYFDAVMAIPDSGVRGEALFPLARAFISAGRYDKAENIYKELEANYPAYQNAKGRAAHLMFNHVEKEIVEKYVLPNELASDLNQLADTSEDMRLQALDSISHKTISDKTALFYILLPIAELSKNDKLPEIRKKAFEVISKLAPRTSFFRSAAISCLLHDPDLNNRYYCATLGRKDALIFEYHGGTINKIVTEVTGRPPKAVEPTHEEWKEIIKKDQELAEEIMKRAEKLGLAKRPKIDWKGIIIGYIVIMLLSGVYCYRIANNRGANKYLWAFLGILIAPISLLFVFIIPKADKK